MNSGHEISLVAGTGLLCVRDGELLFVPSGEPAVVEFFVRSHPGELVGNVTGYAEEQHLEVDDFAAIDWRSGIRIVLFGDIELSSSLRSLPRMSAVEAGTWVERSIGMHDAITIGVNDGQIIERTNLQAGVVTADGFRLYLPSNLEFNNEPLPARAATVILPPPMPPAPIPSMSDGVGLGAESKPHAGDGLRPEPVSAREPFDWYRRDAVDDSSEPSESDSSPVGNPLPEVQPGDSREWFAFDNKLSEPTALHQAVPSEMTATRSRESLDAATALFSGFDSPGDSVSCLLLIEPDRIEPVDGVIILGRQPKVPDGSPSSARTVAVTDPRVSGTHLRVEPAGNEVRFTDLGSTNGTYTLAPGDVEPVQLNPGEARLVEPGGLVQLGGQRVWVRAADND